MIGFNNLGSYGRLGNQMFQYATLRGIAKKHGYEFAIPPSDFQNEWYDHQLFECFKLTGLRHVGYVPQNFHVFQEKYFHFDEGLFNNCPDNVNLFGYFQSEKYFKNAEQEVRQDLVFKDEILNPCVDYRNSLKGEVISLHIRRGDYVNNQGNHPVQPLEYYENALTYFDENTTVMIFSDDPEWCKNQEIFKPDRFLVSETGNNVYDLCMMSLCDHSSFSWWGAWLSSNQNKKVICPQNWFGPALNHDTKDLIPETWIKL
jgi:hypothetical protein